MIYKMYKTIFKNYPVHLVHPVKKGFFYFIEISEQGLVSTRTPSPAKPSPVYMLVEIGNQSV